MRWKKASVLHQNLVKFIFYFLLQFEINFDVFLFLEKVFSYLSADEIEKMKAEEEKKIAVLNRSEGGSLNMLDHSDDEEFIEPPPTRYLFML